MRELYAAAGGRRMSREITPHRPADRARHVAEAHVDPLHGLVALLGPCHDLADAVRGGPGQLTTLERRGQSPAAPATVDHGQPVLGASVVVGPGVQAGVTDDDPALEGHERAPGTRG